MGNYSYFLFLKGSAKVNVKKLSSDTQHEFGLHNKSGLKDLCADFILDNKIEYKGIFLVYLHVTYLFQYYRKS
jgi:hypothetical protein